MFTLRFEASFIQNELDSIDLSALNMMFFTKGEIKRKIFQHTYERAQIKSLGQ